jgi:asparagine synthase (glutamine-hydrolysing)
LQKYLEKLQDVLENSISECKAKTIALSGGLDSSIIAYFLKNKGCNAVAVTTKDFIATDLTYCQLVAKKFNLPLKIIMPTTEELISAINETIKILKNFNDIEIRNSIVIYIVLKSVKDLGESKIILGDGADELFAGYSFFLKKNEKELQKDLERIWKVMHFPSKKIGESLGITVETPFLNDNVMNLAKTIPVNFKVSEYNGKKYGKWILRKAFEDKLPKSVVWRKKSPMQDGAGTGALTHLFDTVISDEIFESKTKQIKELDNVNLRTKESLHYYEVYRKYFGPPEKLHDSKNKCPNCQYEVKQSSKFCRMCGSFPI